jgi:hypothetical protein
MRVPAAPVDPESSLLKAKIPACRLQHCTSRLISAQVEANMLTESARNPHIRDHDAKNILYSGRRRHFSLVLRHTRGSRRGSGKNHYQLP